MRNSGTIQDEWNDNSRKSSSHGLLQKALSFSDGRKSAAAAKCASQKCASQKAITLMDGIYTISRNLQTSSVEQDIAFKQLVDSVLR